MALHCLAIQVRDICKGMQHMQRVLKFSDHLKRNKKTYHLTK